MPDLSALKGRIKTTKSTQQITSVMNAISANKLRIAQRSYESHIVVLDSLMDSFKQAASCCEKSVVSELLSVGAGSSKLFIVISGDRGLCGGFNNNIVKLVQDNIANCVANDEKFKIFCVGRKAHDALHIHKDDIVGFVQISDLLCDASGNFERFVESAMHIFRSGDFNDCLVYANKSIDAMSQNAVYISLIDGLSQITFDDNAIYHSFDGEKKDILINIIELYKRVKLRCIISESIMGEHSARMMAMDNASRNAADVASDLTLSYNNLRQASVTNELIEIVSGANALSG